MTCKRWPKRPKLPKLPKLEISSKVLSALEGGNGASEGPYGLGASHYRRPVHVYGLNVSLSIMVDHIEHHRRNVSSAIML